MPQQTINTPRDTTIQATNTALGLLGKDASLQDIKAALLQIVAALDPAASDYDQLSNKPQVNGVTLTGNKTSKQLGIRQTIPLTSAQYAQLSSAEKMDVDKDYIITDANNVNVPIDDTTPSINKVYSSSKVQTEINTLNSKTAKYTLLWTNPSPSAAFAAQDIQMDISGYDELRFECGDGVFNAKVGNFGYGLACGLSSGVFYMYYRAVALNDTSKIAIRDGKQTNTTNSATTTVNALFIPQKIYGIKLP